MLIYIKKFFYFFVAYSSKKCNKCNIFDNPLFYIHLALKKSVTKSVTKCNICQKV